VAIPLVRKLRFIAAKQESFAFQTKEAIRWRDKLSWGGTHVPVADHRDDAPLSKLDLVSGCGFQSSVYCAPILAEFQTRGGLYAVKRAPQRGFAPLEPLGPLRRRREPGGNVSVDIMAE
jgi:hypothetical protein